MKLLRVILSPSHLVCVSIALLISSCATYPGTSLTATSSGSFLRRGDIVLDLRTDKTSYTDGDPVTITLSASCRASVKLFNEDSTGHRSQIWPNEHGGSNGIVEGGKPITIPAKGSAFILRAGPPYGVNTLIAIAASKPFRLSTTTSNSFFTDAPSFKEFGIRGMTWSASAATGDTNARTGEARLLYEVRH